MLNHSDRPRAEIGLGLGCDNDGMGTVPLHSESLCLKPKMAGAHNPPHLKSLRCLARRPGRLQCPATVKLLWLRRDMYVPTIAV